MKTAALSIAAILAFGTAQAQTATVSGSVVDDRDRPVAGLDVWLDDVTKPDCYCAEHADRTRPDGSFRIVAPRSDYAVRVLPRSPLHGAYARADARNGDVAALRVRVSSIRGSAWPDDPPRAALISVSTDDHGAAVVRGLPGAVPPRSFVSILSLDDERFADVEAAADGSFTRSVYAPGGSSLMIRADPAGKANRDARYQADASDRLAPLAGTIVRAPEPPPLRFTVSGTVIPKKVPFWHAEGSLNGGAFEPGGTLAASGTLTIEPASRPLPAQTRVQATLALERITAADGYQTRSDHRLGSTLLTPTSLPIERPFEDSSFNAVQDIILARNSDGTASTTFALSLQIPSFFSPGLFRPYLLFFFEDGLFESPPNGIRLLQGVHDSRLARLPMIRIGNPAPPKLIWMLLTDALSGGTRGVRASEDRARFNLSPRIAMQAESIVVPRVDRVSGAVLRYRLEPFAMLVSHGDRGEPPDPPLIPFRFPSGTLTVRVTRPDSTVDTLGPAPFAQSRSRADVTYLGNVIDSGAGHVTDAYQLSTMNPAFDYAFPREGEYEISLSGTIEDVWGNVWSGNGTYSVHAGSELMLDTAVLPGTQFETGDAFDPGVSLLPAIDADVEVTLQLMRRSNPLDVLTRVVSGHTNRYGWFHPVGSSIVFDAPGEYRVDIKATGRDRHGDWWAGFRTWGGVVAPRQSGIVAHGRRGIDPQPTTRQQWFFQSQTGSLVGSTHVFFPFHSGDVTWQEDRGAVQPAVTYHDSSGLLPSLVRSRANNYPDFDARAVDGETPLFISTQPRIDASLEPSTIDLWGYSYRSVVRPLVRVREMIGEDQLFSGVYWHFDAQYGGQHGVGWNGDLPNDLKFQFGGVVLRGSLVGEPRYAVYGSLFVLVPDGDADPGGGSRTFPPFQGNGGGPSGGPLLTLKGREVDIFFHPTAVRPGSILEVGDVASFSGQVGPMLPSKVTLVVTSPSGSVRTISGRANHVGYFHPTDAEMVVGEPGVYRVVVSVEHDSPTSAGPLQAPYPSGGILGSADGSFRFYVVDRNAPRLAVALPPWAFVRPADAPITLAVATGFQADALAFTTAMPGFILAEGTSSLLSTTYDAKALHADFPNIDLTDQDGHAGADVVTITLFARGSAEQVLLRGEELFTPGSSATRRRAAGH